MGLRWRLFVDRRLMPTLLPKRLVKTPRPHQLPTLLVKLWQPLTLVCILSVLQIMHYRQFTELPNLKKQLQLWLQNANGNSSV